MLNELIFTNYFGVKYIDVSVIYMLKDLLDRYISDEQFFLFSSHCSWAIWNRFLAPLICSFRVSTPKWLKRRKNLKYYFSNLIILKPKVNVWKGSTAKSSFMEELKNLFIPDRISTWRGIGNRRVLWIAGPD